MPKNRIHTQDDGRKTYKTTDTMGKRHQIKQRLNESNKQFIRRCNELDELCDLSGSSIGTFSDLFEIFEKAHLRKTSNANLTSYTQIYERHVSPIFAHRSILDIHTSQIYRFLQEKVDTGYSREYISKIKKCINAPFTFGVQNGLCARNPCQNIRLTYGEENERESPNKALSDATINEFLTAAKNTKYINVYKLMLNTGMRPSECLGLRWTDISDNYITINRAITIYDESSGKTESANRKIPISDNIRAILDSMTKRTEWLFPSGADDPSMNALTSSFKRSVNQTAVWEGKGKERKLIKPKLEITLYSFRHTFATRCARAGMAAKMLQYIMGHKKIETTLSYYVDIEEEDFTLALEVMDKAI